MAFFFSEEVAKKLPQNFLDKDFKVVVYDSNKIELDRAIDAYCQYSRVDWLRRKEDKFIPVEVSRSSFDDIMQVIHQMLKNRFGEYYVEEKNSKNIGWDMNDLLCCNVPEMGSREEIYF